MRAWVVLVVCATAPARAEVSVTLSPELPVADRLICPAEVADFALGAGSAGRALVAWVDRRETTLIDEALVVGRLDDDGSVLDPSGILLGTAQFVRDPSVAFDGTRYGVAWRIEDTDHIADRVQMARVSADGIKLDAGPIELAAERADGIAVSGGSDQFLVAWTASGQVRARRVAGDGTLLDAAPISIGAGASSYGDVSAIFDGTNYVIVWSGEALRAARVSTAGAVVSPGPVDLVATTIARWPTIVFTGSEYFVAWIEGGLHHMRVSTTMTPIDTPQSPVGANSRPALAFDGTQFWLAYEEDQLTEPGHVELVTVSTTNTLVGTQRYELPGSAYGGEARLAFAGTNLVLGFTVDRNAQGARFATDGTVLDATPVVWSSRLSDQHTPVVAFDGASEYLVGWLDTRDPLHASVAYVARVTEAGGIDGAGTRVGAADGNALALGRSPTPGSTGLVVWSEGWSNGMPGPLRAARVTAAGEILDPDGFVIATEVDLDDFNPLEVACTVTTCLVAWTDDFSSLAVRVDLAGAVIDTVPIAIGGSADLIVAASDDSFLIAAGLSALVPERGPPQQLQLPGTDGVHSWDAAWNGDHFLMVRTDILEEQIQLVASRIDRAGNRIGEEILVARVDGSMEIDVVHDGNQWIVTWSPALLLTPSTAYAARISDGGTLLDPVGVELMTVTAMTEYAGGAAGRIVAIHEIRATDTADRGSRITARWASLTGDGAEGTGEASGCCQAERSGPAPTFVAMLLLSLAWRRSGRRSANRLVCRRAWRALDDLEAREQ